MKEIQKMLILGRVSGGGGLKLNYGLRWGAGARCLFPKHRGGGAAGYIDV